MLGNSCNLSCDFCFWDMRVQDVSWEIKENIIDNIIRAGFKQVTISGGEPSINKDFVNVLKRFKENGIATTVHTNAVKFDASLLNLIRPLVTRISLSLDGSTENICVSMRKDPKAYTSVIRLLDQIIEIGIPVNVKTLITKINSDDIVNIGNFLESKKIDYWTLMEFNPINRGNHFKTTFELDDNTFDTIVTRVKDTVKNTVIQVRLLKREPEKYCFVAPNADVYTCIPVKGDVLVGNIY
ncbi:MAG: Radical SAM domain protein [candidate division WWE3 bacterium GW2011_GWE2_43_18]|nr:MAG: Radical SAM domain protein [candidate division WWE3 bacterium GW2011_GWB1_42_117]KKT04493.1 MAG: Radical SAM domain protein [candidate division WWE3 bacterium GW2011_GWE2_43_18]KKT06172.1 MAG: Radical SAM domain protein [candidate division WWE3 bacterium GW2011_GWF2_43_18]KKT26847.1 MAG: Radical SAM domain protein [candidate division WWE3 bacterium GW2011_GWA1_43_94]KKT44165.1 MAG: Radical SAM domain protein [candidate division WWE3 bacterium GW2011_GWF1_44_14]KKT64728.1 MAG: radical S